MAKIICGLVLGIIPNLLLGLFSLSVYLLPAPGSVVVGVITAVVIGYIHDAAANNVDSRRAGGYVVGMAVGLVWLLISLLYFCQTVLPVVILPGIFVVPGLLTVVAITGVIVIEMIYLDSNKS